MALIASDDSNFTENINKHERVVVKYFADWCGSCKLFAPKFKRLANDERFLDIAFLDVNAETNPEARHAGGVKNLPTFAIFQGGQLIESVSTSKEEIVVELLSKFK